MQTGMVSINDFAATYMCQSLPFGGVKDSGFGRFAGVEGLRALCHPVAMCQDRCSPWDHVPASSLCFWNAHLGLPAKHARSRAASLQRHAMALFGASGSGSGHAEVPAQ